MLIVLVRGVLLYILIMFSLRMMGKRQLGELQPSELVVTILISNIAALPIEDSSIPMLMGIVPVLALVCLDVFVSGAMIKNHVFRRIASGSPRVIISNGEINQKELARLRYSIDDVAEAMRESMIFDISEVQYAIVETTGKINFLQKYPFRNVTKGDMELSQPLENPPVMVIRDGEIDKEGLKECKLSEAWLLKQVEKEKITVQDVFLMSSTSKGDYNIVLKELGK